MYCDKNVLHYAIHLELVDGFYSILQCIQATPMHTSYIITGFLDRACMRKIIIIAAGRTVLMHN